MRNSPVLGVVLVAFAGACLDFYSPNGFADEIKLPITADVGICAHKDEQKINTGARSQIRVKGIEHFYLFNFDAAKLPGPVKKATLHLKLASGKLRQVAFCTVPIAWAEGTARNEAQDGSPCYTHVRYPKDAWTDTGGTFLDATFNNPYMIWRTAEVVYDGPWMKIDIAPELVEAVRVGLSQGLAMSDEKGQTRENHDIFTREQANAAPYLTVETSPAPATAPASLSANQLTALLNIEPCPDAAQFNHTAVKVTVLSRAADSPLKHILGARVQVTRAWFDQADSTGKSQQIAEYVVMADQQGGSDRQAVIRNLPVAPPPDITKSNPKLESPGHFRIQATICADGQAYTVERDIENPPPALTAPQLPKLETPKKLDGPPELRLYPASVCLKPVAKDNPPSGMLAPVTSTNAWVGFQVLVVPPDAKAGMYSLESEVTGPDGTRDIGALRTIRAYREWFVTKDKSVHAEALVPLEMTAATIAGIHVSKRFDVPWQANKVPDQDCQPVFVDVWIPKKTPPGTYRVSFALKGPFTKRLTVEVPITVTAVELPDEFPIVGDMNTYNSPAGAMGVKTAEPAKFMEAERKYYRLAHTHRMTLNVLPYSQSGNIDWRGAPEVDPKTGKVTDWSKWDERYGPLLDGSAFSSKAGYVGPGENTPIHHMYLPFHENWPVPLADCFTPWPPPKDYQKFLLWSAELPPIGKCIEEKIGFRYVWSHAVFAFAEHLTAKPYLKTQYQVYLNNKGQFRDKGRGISLWTLDEPMFSDDFLALRYLGGCTREAGRFHVSSAGMENIQFRVDISRPTHQRNWLNGHVQLNVVSDLLYTQRWWIDYRKRNFGEEYWDYHMPPSFSGDNLGWAAWPVKSYCWGATGTLPWQTIAKDGDFDTADPTALMYPPQRFGLDEPIASIRMKAWRQGLQDATLLHMLRTKNQWTDLQVRALVGQACNLDGWRAGFSPLPEAPIVTFADLKPAGLERLRAAALNLLAK